jgi:hypothetical protein
VNYQPEELVGQIQLWARMTPLEHDELLTKCQIFEKETVTRPNETNQRIVCDFYVNAGTRATILLQQIESKPRLTLRLCLSLSKSAIAFQTGYPEVVARCQYTLAKNGLVSPNAAASRLHVPVRVEF